MEISKKEILAKLYCIKAGLSAISLEKDKLSQEESNCAKIHQEMDDNQKKKKIAIDSLNKVEQDIKTKEKTITGIESNQGVPEKVNIGHAIGIGAGIGIVGGGIGWVVFVFIYDLIHSMKNNQNQFSGNLMGKIWIGMLVGWFISTIVYYFVEKHKNLKNYKKSLADKKANVNKENSAIASLKKNQNNIQQNLSSFDQTNERLNAKHANALVNYLKVKNITIESSKTLYDALITEFSSVLDPRDWANIDLIIFYYETGRADTLKEALQQVDRQRQNEALIKAIKDASNQISSTIQRSLDQLQSTMIHCYQDLSLQLKNQHAQVMQRLSRIQSDFHSLNESVKKANASIQNLSKTIEKSALESIETISSNEYLQHALLEKINVNSVALVDDVNYLLFYKKPNIL